MRGIVLARKFEKKKKKKNDLLKWTVGTFDWTMAEVTTLFKAIQLLFKTHMGTCILNLNLKKKKKLPTFR